jgi:hypothetical protein
MIGTLADTAARLGLSKLTRLITVRDGLPNACATIRLTSRAFTKGGSMLVALRNGGYPKVGTLASQETLGSAATLKNISDALSTPYPQQPDRRATDPQCLTNPALTM